jgi:hypothetical protein
VGTRAKALHDPVTILLDNKHLVRDIITPEKEKIEAKEHFTDGVSSGGSEMQRWQREDQERPSGRWMTAP